MRQAVVWRGGQVERNAVGHQQFFESSIFFGERISFTRCRGKRLLEAQHLLFECFDIHLLPFSMCSEWVLAYATVLHNGISPLCLTIELLSPGQSRFAVRLRTSPLCWLTICVCISDAHVISLQMQTSCRLLIRQTFEEPKLCERTFGFTSYGLPLPSTLHFRRESSQTTPPASTHVGEALGCSPRSSRRRVVGASAGWRV
jgi:hypothetical protein